MKHSAKTANDAAQRAALRRRLRSFYQKYNQDDWDRCYLYLDPKLRSAGRVDPVRYAESLNAFRRRYGAVDLWHVRVSVYLDVKNNKHDDRPFAYVYVLWQDAQKALHVFRERWVYDRGRWYTRVVGLVASET